MSEITTKITIGEIGRKQQPSKFKEGETYTITTIKDTISGRKAAALGAWSDTWKSGDTIEAIWEERKYKDKDGFEQTSWNLKNPNKKEWKGGGGGYSKGPTMVDAYTIAAILTPVLFAGKKVKLDDIAELAVAVKAKLDAATPKEVAPAQATAAAVKSIDVAKETVAPAAPIAEETTEDDDKPF